MWLSRKLSQHEMQDVASAQDGTVTVARRQPPDASPHPPPDTGAFARTSRRL